MTVETYIIRTVGGPHPGNRLATTDIIPWPPPDELPDDGGVYRKASQSELPPQLDPETRVMRGAEYHWSPFLAGEAGDGSV